MKTERIIATIQDVLGIKKPPIGIKVWKEEPESLKKYEGNAFPGMCTQIGEVLATGETFYTDRDQCFCTGGVVATGVADPPLPEEREEVMAVHFSMSKSYKDIETALHYEEVMDSIKPGVPEKNAAVQIGLLRDMPQPDLVVLFCTPGAADILNRAYCYEKGEPVRGFGGNGACPFAIQYPFVTGTPCFTYSDVAWRKYVGMADEELTVTFPYRVLKECVVNLPAVAEAYRRYGEPPEG